MDRALIQDHLAMAERHVAEGEEHLDRQTALIAELERDGHDSRTARDLLGTLKESLALHIADRDRLRRELAAATVA